MFVFVLIIYFFSSFYSQSQPKSTPVINENSFRTVTGYQEKNNNEIKSSMSDNENREHAVVKRDAKRSTNSLYKPLNATEFLAKTPGEIRQEYRKMPNPPAKDAHVAK